MIEEEKDRGTRTRIDDREWRLRGRVERLGEGRRKKTMTTPRFIRFNDTQKPMDVISDRRDS